MKFNKNQFWRMELYQSETICMLNDCVATIFVEQL